MFAFGNAGRSMTRELKALDRDRKNRSAARLSAAKSSRSTSTEYVPPFACPYCGWTFGAPATCPDCNVELVDPTLTPDTCGEPLPTQSVLERFEHSIAVAVFVALLLAGTQLLQIALDNWL